MTRRAALASAAAAVLLATTGCAKFTEPYKDAPRSGTTNTAPADVITMPDGFSNVASKCDGPNRVYVIFKGNKTYGSIAVVAGDARCAR